MSEFDTLYAMYEKQVFGFLRARTHDDLVAQQVAQKAWEQIWEKMSTYDPNRASFRAFAKYWADIMLKRYYDEQRQRNKVEMLSSALHQSDPTQEEREIGDVLARVAAQKSPSQEETFLAEEEEESLANVFEELLRLTFGGTSPPHQLITFGFRQLVTHGEPPQEWKPEKIVAELSDTLLRDLAERLENAYLDASQLPEDDVRLHFAPLRQRLADTLDAVITEPRTRRTHATLLDLVIGETTLRQYYTHVNNPTADVSHWCESVYKRVWSAGSKQGSGPLRLLLQAAARRQQETERKRAQRKPEND